MTTGTNEALAGTNQGTSGASKSGCCGPTCCGGGGGARGAHTATAEAAAAPVAPRSESEAIRAKVREGYGAIATSGAWSPTTSPASKAGAGACGTGGGGGGCCGTAALSADDLARAMGYDAKDLSAIPDTANLGLSCGNPAALAALKPGETVLDLGAGAGFDCFIAGPRVGASGHVIGVDMTPEMLSRARGGLEWYRGRFGLDNVEFRLGEIEHLPVADASVDVVISNCVVNLSPDKARVWREIARVLKPGGRVAISDLALRKPLPEAVRQDVGALVGCIAGAALIDDMVSMARAAGLTEVGAERRPGYVDTLVNTGDPLYASVLEKLPGGSEGRARVGDYVASVEFTARKPG
ncbi:MAG: arsenite methyltransferase [Phycisphaerales bacterium]